MATGAERYREKVMWPLVSHHKGGKRSVHTVACNMNPDHALIWKTPRKYYLGDAPPNYPLPALKENAETAINWLTLSLHPNCPCCADNYMDQLICDGAEDTRGV